MTKTTKTNADKASTTPVTATANTGATKPETPKTEPQVAKTEQQAPKADTKAEPKAEKPKAPAEPKKQTKKELVRQMLSAENGVTIAEIAEKTGWQNHTVHGHLAGVKKSGVTITSEKVDDVRRYRIVPNDNAPTDNASKASL